MARIRTIKPEFFNHEGLADVEPFARLLFIGLWCYADRAGRLKLQPKRLKVQILPYDSVSVNPLLDQLEGIGVLSRYEVDGERYIWIPGFRRNQVFKNENPSILPHHPEDTEPDWKPDPERESNPVVGEDGDNANPAMGEDSPSDKPRKGKERKGKELGSSNAEGLFSPEKSQESDTFGAADAAKQAGKGASGRKQDTNTKNRSQLPERMEYTEPFRAVSLATRKDLDDATCAAEFVEWHDYHRSHGTLIADVHASWRTWLRRIHAKPAGVKPRSPERMPDAGVWILPSGVERPKAAGPDYLRVSVNGYVDWFPPDKLPAGAKEWRG